MKLVAAICCWKEDADMIKRCLASIETICDDYLILNAPFRGFPGAPPNAITQIQARASLMSQCRELGDWILVIDADEVITHANTFELHRRLEATGKDVATVTYTDIGGHPETYPRLYRALPDLTVRDSHNGYFSESAGGFLHGRDYRALDPAKVLDCTRWLAIRHETDKRTYERTQAQLAYRRARHEAGER